MEKYSVSLLKPVQMAVFELIVNIFYIYINFMNIHNRKLYLNLFMSGIRVYVSKKYVSVINGENK